MPAGRPREDVRPRLVVSACLGDRACRWDGAGLNDPLLGRLARWVDLVPVCPEEEIGLGTPRSPVRLVRLRGATRMVQPASGADVTEAMQEFCGRFFTGLKGARAVDGFLLKSRSPSCGPGDARIHTSLQKGAVSSRGAGLFAGAAGEAFPRVALEDEGRLLNATVHDHFLTQLFALARLRAAGRAPTMGELVAFQAREKLLLMAWSRRHLDRCGRLVANPERRPAREVYENYAGVFAEALSRPPRHVAHINVLEHALGYVSPALNAGERRHFLSLLDRYRRSRIPLSSPISVMRSWIMRLDQSYLAGQTYPEDLVELTDSGKGRRPAR